MRFFAGSGKVLPKVARHLVCHYCHKHAIDVIDQSHSHDKSKSPPLTKPDLSRAKFGVTFNGGDIFLLDHIRDEMKKITFGQHKGELDASALGNVDTVYFSM